MITRGKFHYGYIDKNPVIVIPEGVIRWKVKFRNTQFASIFLKYPDRIEHRLLKWSDDETYLMASHLQGVNKRANI